MKPENIHFRKAASEDGLFLWDMLYLAIYVPDGTPTPPLDIIHTSGLACYVEDWGKVDDTGFIALDGETAVGAAWIRLLTGENRGYGYIDDYTPELSLAVLPEYRGQGIGRALLYQLLIEADNHHKAVCLSVSANNPARRLYEQNGFTAIEEVDSSLKMIRFRSTQAN